jgi:hypothetical protein
MAAGLGFKTFATGDVLTAADTNGYLMQGVWVFANAAARSAAVTSPQEGNMSYLSDTNSTEYYSGSAWVAISGSASAASYSLINSGGTSLSGSSTTVSGISGMSSLQILVRNGSLSGGGGEIRIRFNTDTGANYNTAGALFEVATIFPNDRTSLTNGFEGGVVANATNTFSIGIAVEGANSTGFKAVDITAAAPGNTATNYSFMSKGIYVGTSTISSVTIATLSNSFDAGTIYVYGSAV